MAKVSLEGKHYINIAENATDDLMTIVIHPNATDY